MSIEISSIVLAIVFFSILAYVSWLKYQEHLDQHRSSNETRMRYLASVHDFFQRSGPKKRPNSDSNTGSR